MKKYAIALIALLAITGLVQAQDAYPIPVCPNEGTVDMDVLTLPDHILYSNMKETQVSFHWETTKFPEPENWLLEVWLWDQTRYTAYDVVPFSREYLELDVPWLALGDNFPPKFYVRHIYERGFKRCGRTEWVIDDVREMHGHLEPAQDGDAWVFDASVGRMVLTNVLD